MNSADLKKLKNVKETDIDHAEEKNVQSENMVKLASECIYILDAFQSRVREDPDKVMVINPQTRKKVTRYEADEISARVYAWLKGKGIGRESRVMLCLPRGEVPFLAMLGVLKAGAAFTLVEDHYAPKRIEYIRNNFNADLFLDWEAWQEAVQEKPLFGYEKTSDRDLCLAVYTSGTTGQPKGVMHEYGNIRLEILSALEMRSLIGSGPRSMAMLVPMNFVAALHIMFYVLFWGDTMHILPYEIIKNTVRLSEYIQEQKIEYSFMTPSLFRVLPKTIGQSLKLVLIGGEPAHGIYDENIILYNGYAMSESLFMVFGKRLDKAYEQCPSGKPPFALPVHLMNNGTDAAEGESGEICFPNPFFRGYIGLQEKTREATEGGLFHTRDLAKRTPAGEYYIEGRADDMVKINGNRVEPAEVEAAAKKILGLKWCGVRGFKENGRAYLCLYYIDDIRIDKEDFREKMGQVLPYYMIPSYYIHIPKIPLNANGKFVRKLLQKPETLSFEAEYSAPETETEKYVCSLFEKILHVDRAGLKDDFYDLGGDSLTTMALVAALGDNSPDAMEIFRLRTAANIAKRCDEKNADVKDTLALEMYARKRAYPLTAFQLDIFDYQLYHPMTCMWNLSSIFSFDRNKIDVSRFADALNRAMDHHPVFRTVLSFDARGRIVQSIDENISPYTEVISLSEEEFAGMKDGLERPFHLIGKPLLRTGLYATEEKLHFLLSAHHIILDGMGINAILNTIASVYEGKTDLPTDIFFSWLEQQKKMKHTVFYREAEKYLEDTYGKDDWCNNLKPDHCIDELSREQKAAAAVAKMYTVTFPDDLGQKLEKKYGLTENGLFAAVMLRSLHKTEKQENVMINWVFSNRNSPAEESSAGIMLKLLPLGVKIREDTEEAALFKEVALKIRKGIENSVFDWGINDEQVYLNDSLFMVYESGILDVNALNRYEASEDFICDPLAPAIKRSSVQVMKTDEGFEMVLYYTAGLYTDAHLDAFHTAIRSELEKLGCTVTEIESE